MIGKAPEIYVAVMTSGQPVTAEFLRQLSQRPTLIFSPAPVSLPSHVRGKLLAPPPNTTKHEEYRMLRDAGFPVPEAVLVGSIEEIAKIEMNDFVVVKPNRGLRGRGVNAIRMSWLKRWSREDFERSASNNQGMMIQRFINVGPRPTSYRVMTVLGEAVYCLKSISNSNVFDLPIDASKFGVSVASNTDDRVIVEATDHDVVDLAKRVHRKLDFAPAMGIDIIREFETNNLYVLEMNSRGWVWHLSSDHGKEHNRDYSLNVYDQFNALKTITDRLIQETRLRAV